jgi:hypothetical protein
MEATAPGTGHTPVPTHRWKTWGKLNAVSFGISLAGALALGVASPIHGIGVAAGALSVGLGALCATAAITGLTPLNPQAAHLVGTVLGWSLSAPVSLLLSIAFVRVLDDTTTPTPFAAGMWLWALPAAVVYVIVGASARARRSR